MGTPQKMSLIVKLCLIFCLLHATSQGMSYEEFKNLRNLQTERYSAKVIPNAYPKYKRYADMKPSATVGDLFNDIMKANSELINRRAVNPEAVTSDILDQLMNGGQFTFSPTEI